MPEVKTHDTINTVVLLTVLAGLYYLLWKETGLAARYLDTYTLLIFSMSYLFATFFLSPDLDINSKPYKRWGILKIIWWPYKTIFKHRGFSHHPIIGPISIILNLGAIVAIILLIAGVNLQSVSPVFIIAAIAGMVLSMEVHIISDNVISKVKSVF